MGKKVNGNEIQSTLCEEPKDIAEFYRGLLVQIMGFGMAVVVIICVALMSSDEGELFSLRDPNVVAKEAAKSKGVPDSNEYKTEFRKAYAPARKSLNKAIVYTAIIFIGTIVWWYVILLVWLRYKKVSVKGERAIPGGWLLGYCIALALMQCFLAYFILDVDELGLSESFRMFVRAICILKFL